MSFSVAYGKLHGIMAKKRKISPVEAGRKGGLSRSRAKIAASLVNLEFAYERSASAKHAAQARINGRLGGRPVKTGTPKRKRPTPAPSRPEAGMSASP